MRMPAQNNYHVVAIDFSPHTESMQTDALLETGMRPGGDVTFFCCDSGPKRFFWFMFTVVAIAFVGFFLLT